MPLQPSFPDPPPPPKRKVVRPTESALPSATVPSSRTMHSSTEPLYPPAKLCASERPLPAPASGTQARLFHCHCAPKCIEFIKPRDHPELAWVGQVNQPLRTSVVAAGPSAKPNQSRVRTKFADFDVDSKVAYEFNQVGFYSELLSELERTHAALIEVNTRSQQFLYGARIKTPPIEPATRAYVPYYPAQHLASQGRAFVARQPLADARAVAANLAAPTIVVRDQTEDEEKQQAFSFSWQHRSSGPTRADRPPSPSPPPASAPSPPAALACAFSSSSSSPPLPAHLRDIDAPTHAERSASPPSGPAGSVDGADSSAAPDSVSVSAAVASARARLALERAKFAEEMRQQLTARMTIDTSTQQQQQQPSDQDQLPPHS